MFLEKRIPASAAGGLVNMAQPFNEWLQALMDNSGTGNNKLAAYLGVSKTTVSRWRSGPDLPEPPNCYKIAEYFGREPEEILARAGHLQRSEEEIRRLALAAELKVARRQMEENQRLFERIEAELYGGGKAPQ